MNEQLQLQFTRDKVQEALKQMALFKSLGPNGFNACFYQSYWPIIHFEMRIVVLKSINEWVLDNGINFTYIALIPKVKNPSQAKGFRPTSLRNVVYKLPFKVLANQ